MAWIPPTYPETYVLRYGGMERRIVFRHGSGDWGVIYEVEHGCYSRHLPSDARVVVDLGAGIGVFTLLASMIYPEAKIFSYECEPACYGLLVHNVVMNNLEDRVKTYPYAVTGSRQIRRLNIDLNLQGVMGSSLVWGEHGFQGKLDVKCVTLEDVFLMNGLKRIDLLKADIEGSEHEALRNPAIKHVGAITMEVHGFRDEAERLLGFLRDSGFKVEVVEDRDERFRIVDAWREGVG